LLFIETSSKSGHNVEKSFGNLALKIYDSLEAGKFKIQDGWDGIKSGYMRSANAPSNRAPNSIGLAQNGNQSSDDGQSSKKGCC
jgi:hypothetical protein